MVTFKSKKSTEEVFETFFNRFNKKEECTLAKGADIRAFEETFGISFPNDFRVFLKSFGDLFTPDIVDIIDRKGLPICDVQEFGRSKKWPMTSAMNGHHILMLFPLPLIARAIYSFL